MKIKTSAAILALLVACSRGDATIDQKAQDKAAVPTAQTAPAPTASDQPVAPETSPADKKLQDAATKVQQGDLQGALQILEPMRKDGTATGPALSLLSGLYLEMGKAADALQVIKPLADAEDADPAVLFNAARAALALQQTDVAQRYLERSVARIPISPASRELGLLLGRQGRIVEAYRWLRPWALRSPDDLEARINAASIAIRLERPAEAEELLSGLSAQDPGLQLLRAEALELRGNGKGALALLEPLQKNHPPGMDLELRRALAEAYLTAGNPAAAVRQLDGKAGDHPTLVVLLARAQRLSGNAKAATATLQPFLAKIPDDPKAVGDPRPAGGMATEYGRLLLAGGNAAGALPWLEKATRLYPSSREAWEGYADALTAAGRAADATAARGRAKELADAAAARAGAAPAPLAEEAPAQAAAAPAASAASAAAPLSPNLAKAQQLLAQKQPDKALVLVRQEIAIAPKDPRARAVEAQILLAQHNWQGALDSAQAALKLDPQNPDLLYLRGAVQISLRHLDEAEKDLRQVLQKAPNHIAAMDDLAVVMMLRNKPDEARQLLERALALNPNDPNARTSLANLDKMEADAAAKAKPKG
jgi:tetratricopeptide (TPR) repeat protein